MDCIANNFSVKSTRLQDFSYTISGVIPPESEPHKSVPGAWPQTPICAWLSSVPIVLRNDHRCCWSRCPSASEWVTYRTICAMILQWPDAAVSQSRSDWCGFGRSRSSKRQRRTPLSRQLHAGGLAWRRSVAAYQRQHHTSHGARPPLPPTTHDASALPSLLRPWAPAVVYIDSRLDLVALDWPLQSGPIRAGACSREMSFTSEEYHCKRCFLKIRG